MNAEKSYSPTKVMEYFIIGIIVVCGVLATVAALGVINVYQNGWSGALPIFATVAGLTYIGRTSNDKWTLREFPGSYFALSIGGGLLLGVIGVAVKVYLFA